MRTFRLALRTLLRAPFVTGVAIASLALGIGANTAIFSLIQRVLLRPLPVPDPGGLVNVLASGPNPGSQSCNRAGNCEVIFSYPMYRDLEKGQTVLTGLAAHRMTVADLAYKGRTVSGEGMMVSGSYFPVLGVRPALGRLLGPDDDRTPGGNPVIVLSYQYWANDLGSDPGVLDQTIMVNGKPMTVVGVAEKGFDGTTLGGRPRVFIPLTMRQQVETWAGPFEDRRSYWAYVFGRLKPGVTRAAAAAQLNAVYSPIINDVELPLQEGITDAMRRDFKAKKLTIEAGDKGQSSLMGQTATPLALLFAVTAIVLLVACTNVANLLLARAAARSSEIALRSSLGAARSQLIGQLLAESSILAVAAGLASLLVARGTLVLIASFLPGELASTIHFGIDRWLLGFAGLVSLGTSLLFGLLPAIHSTRPDLLALTKSAPGRGSASRSTTRFRTALVTVQIALSMALLCSAGLFIRSLGNVNRVELGIRVDSLVTFAVAPAQIGYGPAATRSLFQRLESELRALPGVTGVSAAMVPLIRDWSNGNDVDVEGFPTTPDADVNSRAEAVWPGFFSTLGIPMLGGREFSPGDDVGSSRVVIVNEAFAKKFKLGPNPIGKRMRMGNALAPESRGRDRPEYEIVGLAKNSAYNQVKGEIPPLYFTAVRQDSLTGRLSFYVRSHRAASDLTRAISQIVSRLDPNLPVQELTTMVQQVNENVYLDRMITAFSAGFAILATLLAAVGLYGVLAYTVTQRTREIGLRMALGADAGRVRLMVLRQVGGMALLGASIGIAGAFAIGRSARSLLYGVNGHDFVAFAGAAILLGLVALTAGFVPAVRASKVHPMVALRAE